MFLAPRLLVSFLCLTCLIPAAHARRQPQQQPQQRSQPSAQGQPAASSSASPQSQGAAPASKKANARPEAAPPAEPFDGAPVEKLAAQCVALETEAGLIEIEMLAEAAPETARNFLNLAATGAYDTTTFSRVVRGFVVQGGDLSTREKMTHEFARRSRRTVADEPNAVKHVRGVVSMARSAEPNSATTHFFILVGDGPHLDGTFAAFGRVRAGVEAADAINQSDLEGDKPSKPVRIKRATVAPCPANPKPAASPTVSEGVRE
ncbi:MAG: peptidylprolyl isomerase [Acidobacteria bacterium]|nr:peptidylprolyl isomerase [Acidobacteriota bacterium]